MESLIFIGVILCGFVIGTLSGMFGIGGGALIVPLLYIVFDVRPIVFATATSLLTIAPTGISGAIKHFFQKTASLKAGLTIGGFGAIASVGGSLLSDRLPSSVTIALTGIVILFSVFMMLRTMVKDKTLGTKADARTKPEADEAGTAAWLSTVAAEYATAEIGVAATEAEAAQVPDTKPSAKAGKTQDDAPLLYSMIIGLIAGGVAGIVGVGGGFIIVPFCVAYLGFSLKKAAGTSLVSIALIAIPGIISHAMLGHIEWLYGVAIMIGTIPGAQLGSWLIDRLPERPMRFAFAGLLTLIGIFMIVQEFYL